MDWRGRVWLPCFIAVPGASEAHLVGASASAWKVGKRRFFVRTRPPLLNRGVSWTLETRHLVRLKIGAATRCRLIPPRCFGERPFVLDWVKAEDG